MTALPITQLQAELRTLKSATKVKNIMQSFHYGVLHDCIMYTQVLSIDQITLIRKLMDKVDTKANQATFTELKYILSSAGLHIKTREN
jgi:hypothetical protein